MVFWITLYLFRLMALVYFRVRVFGKENLPKEGPFIGVVNHQSNLDSLAMSMAINGPVHTMAKDSLFRVPILKLWLKAVHMFPIRRDASDHWAFNHALSILQNGEVLFMAPEGTRKRQQGQKRVRPRTGFVRLAQMVGCPIVPVAIWGTDRALPPHSWFPRPVKVRVKVGQAMVLPKVLVSLDRKEQLQVQADTVMDKVYEMLGEIEKLDRKKKRN